MRIVVAGGSGFLGRPLCAALASQGHEVVVLTRRPAHGSRSHVGWAPDGTSGEWATVLNGAGAVVNLAGESIAGGRWTTTRKQRLLESRVASTRSLVQAMRVVNHPPALFVSGSAVGIYGPRGDEVVTEQDRPGHDFLSRIGVEWEREALEATATGARVILLRTGLALASDGGVLGRMLLPFRLGLGGPLGHGRQYMPWIHRQDWIDLVSWALVTPGAVGLLNATAPEPVTNEEFMRTLARVLRRPAIFRVPAAVLHLALGELAEALLTGQRVVPAKALALGFGFRYSRLEEALREVVGGV